MYVHWYSVPLLLCETNFFCQNNALKLFLFSLLCMNIFWSEILNFFLFPFSRSNPLFLFSPIIQHTFRLQLCMNCNSFAKVYKSFVEFSFFVLIFSLCFSQKRKWWRRRRRRSVKPNSHYYMTYKIFCLKFSFCLAQRVCASNDCFRRWSAQSRLCWELIDNEAFTLCLKIICNTERNERNRYTHTK